MKGWKYCKYIKIAALLFILNLNGLSPLLAASQSPVYDIDIDKEQCLFEVLRSPITKYRYPKLLTQNFANESYNMLTELNDFCSCSVKTRKAEILQRKVDKMSWRFRDKKQGLAKEDQCAITIFSDETMQLYYQVIVASRFMSELEDKLKNRIGTASRALASNYSFQTQMNCTQEKILRKCTRIKSLRSTYQCIQETVSDPSKMDNILIKCPNLIEKNNYKITSEGLTI